MTRRESLSTPERAKPGVAIAGKLHSSLVFGRRVRRLAANIYPLFPVGARILDVGCGDGSLDALILRRRTDVTIEGVDVAVRPGTRIPVRQADGVALPYGDASFDAVLFVDVLHHTEDPLPLLREARRVAKECVVIKDHARDGVLAGPTLRFMDWFGNKHYGVVLPYNYLSMSEWQSALSSAGLRTESWVTKIGLYPWPASVLFDRRLHFVARLAPAR
jgi:SAM-dependent methyltransferase